MKRSWYAVFFTLAVLVLGVVGLFAFQRLALNTNAMSAVSQPLPTRAAHFAAPKQFIPIARNPTDYAVHEAADAAWRRQYARPYTLSELRARGDGTRSPREALQDRVYAHTRRGQDARAIAELERWVARHPNDERALLTLARLLNENGRNNDAIVRYRQLLAIKQRNTE
jgi:Flp pilus assembly protein TadD